ncbi:MAG: PQQ-dependent sugar dehydrogenase [Planctomycetaceae bacterium]|nr:PQQ-dependent sugar dehydrogenase [Planctomycetaceae bacterium]
MAPKKGGEQLETGSCVSRFTVTETGPPEIDPASEQIVITWLNNGHNGGCLKFGPDGCLYISTGDGSFPNPPDARLAGQDVSNLLSSVLRIDVDHPDAGRNYGVPADNPFVKLEGARPEIWAYGFRNPWKMSFDRKSGQLWLGDVGWEMFEMVHRIERGGNYGWSIMEGTQTVRAELKPGPTPISPPMISLPHSLAASVTGGFVYRGKKFPEFEGQYFFGDWETRRMWAATFDDARVLSMQEIVQPTVRLVAFCEDDAGELFVLDYDAGTIHEFERNDQTEPEHPFPRKLSDSGLFADVKQHEPAPGVVPFEIAAPMWSDHATVERLVALPGNSTVLRHPEPVLIPGTIMKRILEFPANGVLARTLTLEMEAGNPASARRIETQILHYTGQHWNGYSYRWNDDQTDAELVPADGAELELTVHDAAAPGGQRQQKWTFSGRAACARCHNPWAQHKLAFSLEQLNRPVETEFGRANQLRYLTALGILRHPAEELVQPAAAPAPAADGTAAANGPAERTDPEFVTYQPRNELARVDWEQELAVLPQLANPYDPSEELDQRARAWLHANCAHCHQQGAGGTADIELRATFSLEKTKAINIRPLQGTFGIHDCQIIAPGDPYRSVLFLRLSKTGRGHMPHIGSHQTDEAGVSLIHDWIRQLPVRSEEHQLITELAELDEAAALAREKTDRAQEVARTARRLARAHGGTAPTPADWETAKTTVEAQERQAAASRPAKRQKLIARLLEATAPALHLARAVSAEQLPPETRQLVIATAVAHPQSQIRDLFEAFLPPNQRTKRLGEAIDPAQILALTGNLERGRNLFFQAADVQCRNCHRIEGQGRELGPDLSGIGKKLTRPQLLESLLEPSKRIEAKYVVHLVETTRGLVHTGLLVRRDDTEVVLADARGKEIRIPADEVEEVVPQRQSLMPDLLLRDMTADQVADLLEFLSSLKKPVAPGGEGAGGAEADPAAASAED